MSNVIRPTFGAKPEQPGPDDWTPVEIGKAVARALTKMVKGG